MAPIVVHAGLVAARVHGRWQGVLIEGPPGAGKSDLALRAFAEGFALVADDRVVLWTSEGRLYGRAPDALAGLLEVRGLDVVRISAVPLCEVALLVGPGAPDRLPEPAFADILGLRIPRLVLPLSEASAPAKLSRAISHFARTGNRRI